MLYFAPVRAAFRGAAFRGAMGKLPPVPTSSMFIEDVLTGKAQAPALYPTFDHALFRDHSDQALRPKDPTALLAYAEAAQHGMQAGVPNTTDAKNKTGWRLWEQFMREVGGDSPALRQPDPEHLLRKRL